MDELSELNRLAIENFDRLPDSGRVRGQVVAVLEGCHLNTVWRMVQDGRLPAPVKDGNITTWSVGELRQYRARRFHREAA